MNPRNFHGSWFRQQRISVLLLILFLGGGAAEAATPAQWVRSFWPTAKAAGISLATYNAALGNFTPDPVVLEKASNQAEFSQKIWLYLHSMVTEKRIATGQALVEQYASLLRSIEARYGVDRYIVVAIWGMESTFGEALNNPDIVRNTIRSLATLAYQGGSRAKFGRTQLIVALKILQHGDVTPSPHDRLVGGGDGAYPIHPHHLRRLCRRLRRRRPARHLEFRSPTRSPRPPIT